MFGTLLLYSLPLLLASIAASVIATYAWRHASVSGAPMLSWLAWSVTVWTFGYALELLTGPPDLKLGWAKAQYLGIVGAPLAWMLFSATFSGRPGWLSSRLVLLMLIPPAITVGLVLTNEGHGLIWREVGLAHDGPLPLLALRYGPWFWVHTTYSYLLMASGSLLLVTRVLARPMLYRRQIAALLTTAAVPWAGNSLYLARIAPFDVLDPTPFAFALSALILSYALFRERLLDLVPVARDTLVAGMRDGLIVLDLHGRVVDFNRAAAQIFGWPAVGEPAAELFAGYPALAGLPLDAARHQITIVVERDGRRSYEVSADAVTDGRNKLTGRLVLVRDVTERTRDEQVRRFLLAEQATMQRVARAINSALELDEVLRTVVQQIYAAFHYEIVSIWLREGDALVVQAHQGYTEPPGPFVLTRGVIGRVARTGQPAFVRDAAADPDFVYRRDDVCQAIMVPLTARDGATSGVLLIEANAAGRQLADEDYALLLLLADQVSVAVTNARLFDELRAAKAAAEQATRDRSTFLAHMSHEIRASTHAVVGVSELLVQTPLALDQLTLVEHARASTRALLELLNDTLDIAKLEAQRLTLASAPFSLRECVESAVEQVALAAAAKQVDVSYALGPGVPPQIIGDRVRLRQILVNLLGNGVKYTAAGEVSVSVSAERAPDDGVTLTFAVRDTGIGIVPESMRMLFQPFIQTERTAHTHAGTGLGLAISKQLSELMGGTMWAGSDGATGSTFFFTIRAAAPPAEPPELLLPGRLAGTLILLLAEATGGRRSLADALRRRGAQVRETDDVAEALAWVAGGAPFALALIGLPDQRRHAAASELRALRDARRLPLLQLAWLGPAGASRPPPPGLYQATLYRPIMSERLCAALDAALFAGDAAAAPAPAAQPPLRILVADDDDTSRLVAQRLLELLGHQVLAVEDGQLALDELAEDLYDVVMLDARMPGLDGVELARAIRRGRPRHTRPYLIAITGDVLPDDQRRYADAGIDEVLKKPVWLTDLVGALRRYATDRAARARLAGLRGQYLQDVARLVETIADGHARQDLAAVARAAHRLKGGSDLFDDGELGRLGALIEDLARAGDGAALAPLVAELLRAGAELHAERQG